MISSKPAPSVYVFDAYGTLFDVHSAVATHAHRIDGKGEAMSELWRARQVEYSWTYSLMGRPTDFWELTQQALDYAMARFGLDDVQLRRDLLDSYLELHPYPEVPTVLRQLKQAGKQVVILSNGTSAMLRSAVTSAGIGDLVDRILSIDEVGIFKPSPRAYQLVLDRAQVPVEQVSFQSSNPWDAAGAGSFGFRVVWVNRRRLPPEYPFEFLRTEVESLDALCDESFPPA